MFDNVADGTEYRDGERPAQARASAICRTSCFRRIGRAVRCGSLSGGERNRLLLARLFTRRFNVLVLDEPTNDLDIETLDLLEDLLVEFTGTVLLVSHDREFLDNVVTSTLVFEGDGAVREYAGGYDDWVRSVRRRRRSRPRCRRHPARRAGEEAEADLSFKPVSWRRCRTGSMSASRSAPWCTPSSPIRSAPRWQCGGRGVVPTGRARCGARAAHRPLGGAGADRLRPRLTGVPPRHPRCGLNSTAIAFDA